MERVNNYKVNILNKNGKEIWKYCVNLERAVNLRETGKQQELNSVIFGFKRGKWVAL